MSRSMTWGTAIGIALGVAYTASPLTVWFAIAMAGLFAWAGRGLGEGERRMVWVVLAVGVGVRVFALALLFLLSDHALLTSFFWDGDGVYLKYRALVIRNVMAGIPVSQPDSFHAFDRGYGWSSYLYLLAYLQYLTGPAPFGIHLLNTALYMATAVILYRLVRPAYGRTPALAGLAVMLLLPTLIAWSVSALKESLYIFLCAVGLTAAVTVSRHPRLSARVAAIAVLAGVIAANGTVRTGASAIMIAGLAAGLAASFIARRALLVLLLVVLVPVAAVWLWERPGIRTRVIEPLRTAAARHVGNVTTPGNSYRLLDRRNYETNGLQTMRPDEGRRFIGRALVSFVTVPLPWQVESRAELVFLGQQVIWYIVVILAGVGFIGGLRRDPLVTCLLAGVSAVGAATIALNGGNVGTLVRFRDTVVPFVLWLGALGATLALARAFPGRVTKRSAPCP